MNKIYTILIFSILLVSDQSPILSTPHKPRPTKTEFTQKIDFIRARREYAKASKRAYKKSFLLQTYEGTVAFVDATIKKLSTSLIRRWHLKPFSSMSINEKIYWIDEILELIKSHSSRLVDIEKLDAGLEYENNKHNLTTIYCKYLHALRIYEIESYRNTHILDRHGVMRRRIDIENETF